MTATLSDTITAEEKDEARHTLHITDKTGDTEVSWHKDNREEVAMAEAAFKSAQDKKMLIYRTDRHGNKAERMTTWDPSAEKIIATPQYVGG